MTVKKEPEQAPDPETPETYRIVEYYAENFKRLRLVNFKPTGRLTIFSGKNGQGKTSALDAVAFALGGKKWSPEMPIRKGANHFTVQLGVKGDRGSFVVRRTQSGLRLEMADGCTAWDTPQRMLDSIFDELALDPIEFIRMKPEAQVEMLRKSMKLDEALGKLTQQNEEDFRARTLLNREIQQLQGQVAAYVIQGKLPKEKLDEAEIEGRIREANEFNRGIAGRIQERMDLTQQLQEAERSLAENTQTAKDHAEKLAVASAKIPHLKARIEAVEQLSEEIPEEKSSSWPAVHTHLQSARREALSIIAKAREEVSNSDDTIAFSKGVVEGCRLAGAGIEEKVNTLRQQLENFPSVEMRDAAALVDELKQAQMVNREIDRRNRCQELEKELAGKQEQAGRLTRAIEDREERKRTAVANAKMPIPGLAFDTQEEQVLFDGVPLQQLGEAQQIRISVALILARNPKLRIVRIPHGEALDEDSLAALAAMAEELDFYVWMARVDSTGKVGIYLEDGEIKAVNE